MVLTVRLLDILIGIDGPDHLIGALAMEFHGGILGSLEGTHNIVWNGLSCRVDGIPETIDVQDESLIGDVTRMMIRRLITMHKPGVLLLHGNAIVHEGRTIVFAGESGVGKSTLSLEFMEALYPKASLLAEDLVIIDPDGERVHPYPRASRLKSVHGDVYIRHERQVTFPALLENSHFIFLRHSDSQQDSQCISTIGLSVWNSTAARIVKRHASSSTAIDLCGKTPLLRFTKSISHRTISLLRHELEANGILVMTVHEDTPIRSVQTRPLVPVFGKLPVPDALKAAMRNLVAPLPAMGGSLMIAMAKALSGSQCWELTPGGTPTETVHSFLEALSAA
ncbi:MAG: hypothetical protein JJU11_14725 [Candidatus Sumerlaeia bacterium]|nr:hypothetical protein [Candidatus Sumerlaeia bacterium]